MAHVWGYVDKLPTPGPERLDATNAEIEAAIEAARQSWGNRPDRTAAVNAIATSINKKATDYVSKIAQVNRQTAVVGPAITHFRELNLRLISSVPDNVVDDLVEYFKKNNPIGLHKGQLTKLFQERAGVSKSRAEFWARDQTNKLNGQIVKLRAQGAGLGGYIWRTSNDERVRGLELEGAAGPNHHDLDGETFTWDDPPVVDTATGRRANPGEDYQCRCTPEPVFIDEENQPEPVEWEPPDDEPEPEPPPPPPPPPLPPRPRRPADDDTLVEVFPRKPTPKVVPDALELQPVVPFEQRRVRALQAAGTPELPNRPAATHLLENARKAEQRKVEVEALAAQSKGVQKTKLQAQAKTLDNTAEVLRKAHAKADEKQKGVVYSKPQARVVIKPPPEKIDGTQALATETPAAYDDSIGALKAIAKGERKAVRDLIRQHTGGVSRDLARGLDANATTVEEHKGAFAVHHWSGQVALSPAIDRRFTALRSKLAAGSAHLATPDEWQALSVVAHEELHGMSSMTRSEYRVKFGANTEEVFTEILARKTLRQTLEDVYGAEQPLLAEAESEGAAGFIGTALPRSRTVGLKLFGSYNDIIGDVVDAFDGDVELLERAILHARRARSADEDATVLGDPKRQMREALSTLPAERAAKIMQTLEELWS